MSIGKCYKIQYQDEQKEISERVISILSEEISKADKKYYKAFDWDKGQYRSFREDRVLEVMMEY